MKNDMGRVEKAIMYVCGVWLFCMAMAPFVIPLLLALTGSLR